MDLIVTSATTALWGKKNLRCAIGKMGVIAANLKREGDGKTPVGRWPIREVIYRPDRMALPVTSLPLRAMQEDDAWCDMPDDPNYNKRVKLPYATLHERLWRGDHLYDVIAVLGYNDAPVAPWKGSAIFLHVARLDFGPSSGCVTLQLEDVLTVLREAERNSCVDIRPPA